MKKTATYYQVLGVQPQVSIAEIKKAYRKLAKSLHPDIEYSEKTAKQRDKDTEKMARVNEAYETLSDKYKRAHYDSLIGANGHGRFKPVSMPNPLEEDELRERYLRRAFHPARHEMLRVLRKYKSKLTDLSQDIFDDRLVAKFEEYVSEVEETLRESSQKLSSEVVPHSLHPAVQMMRIAVAQAADGLEDMKRFCQSYDYSYLATTENLFHIATDLSSKSLNLTKI